MQLPLFDPTASEKNRDEAIARVEEHADPDWRETALRAVEVIARRKDKFTSDDVWRELLRAEVTTHEPRALGAVMRSAGRLGIIRATADFVAAMKTSQHRRPIRIWQSLIRGGEEIR